VLYQCVTEKTPGRSVRQRIVDQLDNLTALQRLFGSVETVDWRAFEKFAGPMVGDHGIRGFGWLPMVEGADRGHFERRARQLWGDSFVISERNAEGAMQPVADRTRYFPVLYAVPLEPNHLAIGVNLHAASNRGPLIEQAIDTGLQVSSDLGPLLIDNRQTDTVVIVAPVYRGGDIPPTRDQRRAAIQGIVLGVLSMNQMFDAANAGDAETGLNVFLLDQTQPEEQQLIRAWTPFGQLAERATAAVIDDYRAEIEIGRRLWAIEVEATPRWLERNGSPTIAYVPLVGGLLTLLLLTYLHSVLNRRAMAEELVRERTADLLERENSYRTLVENLPVIISRYDDQFRHLFTNASFEHSLGLAPGSVLGKTLREVFANFPGLDTALLEQWESALATVYASNGTQRIEFGFPTRLGPRFFDGVLVPEHSRPTGVTSVLGIFHEITERKAAQQRAEFLAHHDPLTGLPNRLLLRDRLEQALATARRSHGRVALMFLDLDRFKTINDSLGHPVGDKLLQAVVARLTTCVRESDTISRQGGDEFVIVLRDARDSESVSRLADKIQQRMGEPFRIDQHALSTSFSIGIALFPDDGQDFDSLTQKADTAMYHAKHAGRNAHRFFTEQMNVQAVEHMHLETRLRRAIERAEFVLHYQPQTDLASGAITGVEALVRWQSPDQGLVAPAKFIPIAEETGLIVPLGKWVLGEACRQASAWQAAGLPPFSVAVNLSGLQFRRSDLLETVINALVLADLDSQWLELELTESILIQDAEVTLETARRLKAIGVRLSVDDFGTGYSSLAYLKRFAVDKIKIARPFVRDLVSDADDAAIVRAIVQMAHALKLRTIAEGVESAEVAEELRLSQCDEIQGYWIARPMPADALAAFVLDHQRVFRESRACDSGNSLLPAAGEGPGKEEGRP
jgi:diguanylate cyclase (GGDEF)-like protein/PAS domain S-box-containing protein